MGGGWLVGGWTNVISTQIEVLVEIGAELSNDIKWFQFLKIGQLRFGIQMNQCVSVFR